MTKPTRNSERKSPVGPVTIAALAIASVAITIIIVVYSIDWETYLDERLAEAMMADTGAPTRTPKDVGLNFANAVITTADGVNLAGWFIPSGQSKVTIVFCRGAEGNIGLWLDMIKQLQGLNYNVLAFDYRGTGLSGGNASFIALEKDITAAVNHAKQNFGKAASRIAIFGVSIGAAVGINVAAELDAVDAIVADSPFSSFAEMVPRVIMEHAPQLASKMPDDEEITDEFDPIKSVSHVSPKPLFIVANENDELCPVEMARKLHQAARAPKNLWVAPGTRHIEAKDVFPTEYWAKVAEFFDHWLVGVRAPEIDVSKRVKELPDGTFEVKLRVSNIGAPLSEDVPVAVIIETEAGDIQMNIYFPTTKLLTITTDSKPIGYRAMRFFNVERQGDSWRLLPG